MCRFDPWNLGKDVRLAGLKILVVAESHYRECRPDSDFLRDETQKIVKDHGLGLETSNSRSRLFGKIGAVLATDEIKGAEVWRSIYFYNYFQRPMDQANDAPIQSDFDDGVAPFDEVLRTIKPDAVLVMSARLWHGMKNECSPGDLCALGRIYEFSAAANLRIPGAHTYHPSARGGFEVDEWRPRVWDFLDRVRDIKLNGHTDR